MFARCKEIVQKYGTELFIGSVLILSTTLAFGLGRLSTIEEAREPIAISSVPVASTTVSGGANGFVASRTGTKYHLPWCPGAQKISVTNKIVFDTRAAAERAGYTPAANCKGL